MTKKELEAELKKAKKEIEKLKACRLFDFLAAGLKSAGMEFETDSCDFDDDYISFPLYSQDRETRYTISFSFNEDASLSGVRMFSCKKLHGYDEANNDQCGWTVADLIEKEKWTKEKVARFNSMVY